MKRLFIMFILASCVTGLSAQSWGKAILKGISQGIQQTNQMMAERNRNAAGNNTATFTYAGGYFTKNGNTWKEYRNGNYAALYAQYTEDEKYYYITRSSIMYAVPKNASVGTNILYQSNGTWNVLYTNCYQGGSSANTTTNTSTSESYTSTQTSTYVDNTTTMTTSTTSTDNSCPTCHGSGYVKENVKTQTMCHQCYGNGKCHTCSGKGWHTGYSLNDHISCTICGQSGRCHSCSGTGKVEKMEYNQSVKCRSCNGTGRK